MNDWDVIRDFAAPIKGAADSQADMDKLYAHLFAAAPSSNHLGSPAKTLRMGLLVKGRTRLFG
jgi:hypothetical protein